MSFMAEIEAAQQPRELLANDFFQSRNKTMSIDFRRRVAGMTDVSDAKIAKRLAVAISTVRDWREIGRR